MFQNREEAARRLVERLQHYLGSHPLVLAIPRGGVPMGRIVAEALEGDLDVVLVHKLGAPGNPEYAIGAVEETGQVVMGEGATSLQLPQGYIDQEVQAQLRTLHARRERYGKERIAPLGRTVIVVDDGVATGATLLAALDAVRRQEPARLVAAIGVSSQDAAELVRDRVDEFVCLEIPPIFFAVSRFFMDFRQVTDEEVIQLLEAGGNHERHQRDEGARGDGLRQ